ncbi:MAG: FecR domain-containing protein [Pseudomonadota bacterium]
MIPRARTEALGWDERLKRDRSAATRAEFEGWLAADPANRAEYAQMAALDTLMAKSQLRAERPVPRARHHLWPAVAMAGAIGAVAIVALVGSPFLDMFGGPTLVSPAQAQLTRPVRLSDGTLMILSSEAKAEPRFTRRQRQVVLTHGSARFFVSRDPTRPFVVVAGAARVSAAIAVVDVDMASTGARVTVREGSVTVDRPGGDRPPELRRTIDAAQSVDVASMTIASAPAAERVTVIEADRLALDDLIRIANDASTTKLGVSTAALGVRRVSGRFDIRDHHVLVRRLAAALGLRVVETDGRLLLTPP